MGLGFRRSRERQYMRTPTSPTNHTQPWRGRPVAIPLLTAGSAAREGQERFAAFVAHELRTPIALQRAVAEAALADPHADAAVFRAMAQDIVASCEQQQHLIDALLCLTQSQEGRRRHEPVDLAAITSRLLRAHDVSMLESIASLEPAQTSGDPDLIERLAANLLSNATRYNVTRGRIEVATRTEAEHAVLSIANTGQLIPDAELTRLFQPFQRLASRSAAISGGVGLGLAIVQAIADAHDAIITAQARPDGGLKIDVSFPVKTRAVVPA
jgi:signal transduction histidine kinase